MLKTIQIIKWMTAQGFNQGEILDEFQEIVNNERSEYFELTEFDIKQIREVYENEDRFDRAVFVGMML